MEIINTTFFANGEHNLTVFILSLTFGAILITKIIKIEISVHFAPHDYSQISITIN